MSLCIGNVKGYIEALSTFTHCVLLRRYSILILPHSLYRSPGYGLTLVSESTTGVLHSAELFSNQPLGQEGEQRTHTPALPEDIGRQTALLLIQEIVQVCVWSLVRVRFFVVTEMCESLLCSTDVCCPLTFLTHPPTHPLHTLTHSHAHTTTTTHTHSKHREVM